MHGMNITIIYILTFFFETNLIKIHVPPTFPLFHAAEQFFYFRKQSITKITLETKKKNFKIVVNFSTR